MGSTPVRAAVAAALSQIGQGLYGVACSGGADSLALADAVITAAGAPHVVVLTIDHGLQPGSAEVAARVAAWARGRGAAAMVRRVAVAGRSEAAARRVRYTALDDLAAELGCCVVMLGHTRRDQAETVLMRIVRGTGPAGLVGIRSRRIFVRPLLRVRRSEVEAYCAARELPVWDDPMNDDADYLRVRARKQWLPLLARSNANIEDSLVRLACHANEWLDLIDQQVGDLALPVDCPTLAAQMPAVRKRVVALGLEARGLGYTTAHLDAADALIRAPRHGTVSIDVPGGRIIRAYDVLDVRGWGDHEERELEPIPEPPGHRIRAWQPGDRMRPVRLKGRSRKLSDLFADLRVPRASRVLARVVVRESDGVITYAEHVGHAVDRID